MNGGASSPWSPGRLRGETRARLLFGVMYEDVAVEEEVLAPCERIFAIGSSGDTALRLAAVGRRVTAVDVNPAQVAYLQERLKGGPRKRGTVDRLLGVARQLAPLAGWTRGRVERFLQLSDVGVQRRVFDRLLDTTRFRTLMDIGLAPATLLRSYRPEFVDLLPAAFGSVLRERLRRGISTHPNRENPYARLLLRGDPPTSSPPLGPVEVRLTEAARFLEQRRPATYDGFTLSNVLDGPDERFRSRLAAAIARAGTPDAPVVLRTLRQPIDEASATWAARDRSMIWGALIVTTAAALPTETKALT